MNFDIGGIAQYFYSGQFLWFILLLTLIVFIHELGHFLVARWCGVGVSVFSIGFGPEIFGFNDRHGTRWRFAWLPLGGYVKFIDDQNAASAGAADAASASATGHAGGKASGQSDDGIDPDRKFHSKTVGQRAAIVAAGPIANFLLAIVIFAGIFVIVGKTISIPRVDGVVPGSPAEKANFQIGDIVLAVDGMEIESFSDLQRIVSINQDQELAVLVRRDNREVTLSVIPAANEIKDNFGNTIRTGMLGISHTIERDQIEKRRYDPLTAVWKGTEETYFFVSHTLSYIGRLVTGRADTDQLGGPIRIAQVASQAGSAGFDYWINIAAVLSISIGLLNLFPIPILDGGHLLFYAIEAIRGQPLSEQVQEIGFRIGLALLVMLMIFATGNDLHIWKSL